MAGYSTDPLVLNITHYVVMNATANALLSIGASPVMAHRRSCGNNSSRRSPGDQYRNIEHAMDSGDVQGS